MIKAFVLCTFLLLVPATFGVEPRDYEEALKEDEVLKESVTEYPNGVNVIPGQADIHYPILAKIPKSAFSCRSRLPGFYADSELRCQVWHICDESGVQQSFLCTNGTIYSQDKRVCDWWYNVNCDPEEVNRNYAQNKELYKGPPKKEGSNYQEEESNELPPVHRQPSHRPQEPHQQQQRQQQQPQQRQQEQRPQQQPQQRQQNNQQGQERRQEQRQPQRDENLQRSQSSNYIAPRNPQSLTPVPQSRPTGTPPPPGTPEKKRVIVLRLPGPLPPGATIPPHILMEYAESVLAAERAGKAPPSGLSAQTQQSLAQHQRSPPPPTTPRPTTPRPTQPPQQPQQSPQPRGTPRGPIVPYTPRPFSQFLEDASRFNGQTKTNPKPVQQTQAPPQPQQNYRPPPPPPQQQEQQRRQPEPQRPSQQQQPQRQSYEEPRQQNQNQQQQRPQQTEQRQQTQRPQQQQQRQNNDDRQNVNNRPSQQQRNEEQRQNREEPQQAQEQRPQPPKKPVSKPKSLSFIASSEPTKKFRHSTPRKHGEVKFAPKSFLSADDVDEERQFTEESRRPAYNFNANFKVPSHLSPDASPKEDFHVKSAPVEEVAKPNRVRTTSTTTTTTTEEPERFLTTDEIIEPAIRRLVLAAGLKIKDPRNKQLATSSPSRGSSSEETYNNQRQYEPVKVIVARRTTTTTADLSTTSTTTTTRAPEEEVTTPRVPVTRRVIKKKLRAGKVPPTASSSTTTQELTTAQQQRVTKRPRQSAPSSTTEEFFEYTKATRDYGFDVYGRNEDEDEEEELVKAAQEYYQASEHYGKRKRV